MVFRGTGEGGAKCMLGLASQYWLTNLSVGVSAACFATIARAQATEAASLLVVVLGFIYVAAAVVRDHENKRLRADIKALEEERSELRAKWIQAEVDSAVWEIKAKEAIERRYQSDIFTASEMVDRFREGREQKGGS